MSVRLGNKIKLKHNFVRDYISNIYGIVQIITPNYKNIYSLGYFKAVLEFDTFDINLALFDMGYGYIIKIKEIIPGIWVVRFPDKKLPNYIGPRVIYLYEPKAQYVLQEREKEGQCLLEILSTMTADPNSTR